MQTSSLLPLADAQLIIAREHGHASWRALRAQLATHKMLRPARPGFTVPIHSIADARSLLASSVRLIAWRVHSLRVSDNAVVTRECYQGTRGAEPVE